MKTFHIFRIKYFPITNSRPSRVKIISDRFKQSVISQFNHTHNSCEDQAAEYLTSKGFNVLGCAEGYIVTDTFEPLKK